MKNSVSTLVKSCRQCHPRPASRSDKPRSQPRTSPTTPIPSSSSAPPRAILTDTKERLLAGLCPPSPPPPPDQPQPDAQPRPGPLPPSPPVTPPHPESPEEDFDQLVARCMSFHDNQEQFFLENRPTFSLVNV